MGFAGGADLPRKSVEGLLAPLVASQYGVFSRDQATRLGVSKNVIRRRLEAGRWETLHPNVFRVAGSPSSWRQSLVAACLAWGEGSVVSHRAAAALWRLAGFGPGPIELIVTRKRKLAAAPGIVARRLPALPPADVGVVDAIPVTTVARTLIDLASVAPREAVEEALDDALRRRLVSLSRLRWRVSELSRSGRPGVTLTRSLLAARDPSAVPESVFETRLLRILTESGVPRPVLQHPLRDHNGLVAVVDFAFPAARLAVEADGYRWHSGRVRWEHDLARRNALTSLGWRVIHVKWEDLTSNRIDVIRTIKNALARGTEAPSELARDGHLV